MRAVGTECYGQGGAGCARAVEVAQKEAEIGAQSGAELVDVFDVGKPLRVGEVWGEVGDEGAPNVGEGDEGSDPMGAVEHKVYGLGWGPEGAQLGGLKTCTVAGGGAIVGLIAAGSVLHDAETSHGSCSAVTPSVRASSQERASDSCPEMPSAIKASTHEGFWEATNGATMSNPHKAVRTCKRRKCCEQEICRWLLFCKPSLKRTLFSLLKHFWRLSRKL